jgi:hypothetical protein
MFNGVVDAQQCLLNAMTVAHNARTNGADKVLVCQVLKRMDAYGINTGNAQTLSYNAMLAGNAAFDAVVRGAEHPILAHPENPLFITGPDPLATGPTRMVGCTFDAAGIHPRHFGQACLALMLDQAYAAAWGTALPYRPSVMPKRAAATARGVVLQWENPQSTESPAALGDTTSGASFLAVKIRRQGVLIAVVYPALINTNTGAATYTTSYLDLEGTSAAGYTIECVDAAGSSSGIIPFED